MKKLLLTSSFHNVADQLLKIIPRPANQMVVAFVPTAADPYDEKPWMEADKQKLVDLGFKIIDLPLKGQNKETIDQVLNKVDIIFVEGGNTFYLLDEARKSGFTELVPKLLDKGVIYVGSSAGSYITGMSIETSNWKKNKNLIGLKDLTGMCIVPFIMFAHYTTEYEQMLKEKIPATKYPVKVVTNDQAILVEGEDYKLVGKGDEIKIT